MNRRPGLRGKPRVRKFPLRYGPDWLVLAVLLLGVVAGPARPPEGAGPALAYIGPGAGFAVLGSFLSLLAGFLLSVASLLLWPFRMLWWGVRRRRGFRRARIRRLILLGLDGLDPRLTERFLAEGKLPNLARLRRQGSYRRLRTTYPSLSPAAWSTFATGVSPARHNIFDFLSRDVKSYLPELSSARVHAPRRMLKLGRLRIPLARPYLELRRKSRSFWQLLGERGIGCTILRVPVTFPPEKFNGRLLSAMCTPDLKGTQGTFAEFTTRRRTDRYEGGNRYPLRKAADYWEGAIEGPEDGSVVPAKPLRIGFRIRVRAGSAEAVLELAGRAYPLRRGEYTPWIKLTFRTALGGKISGMARFLLKETEPECTLYMSPLNLDPDRPALPISHPRHYAVYLACRLGPYATLGMPEDSWACNEGVLDEGQFLQQVELIHQEREAMFVQALETTRRGVVACVFDAADRVQHMFYRYVDPKHPAFGAGGPHAAAIEETYRRMDRVVGTALRNADSNTVLFVLSDHGFRAFRRGVNLNSWLRQNGYLTLEDGLAAGGRYFRGVDWSRTRAYALGLAGVYLNLRGREARGVVAPGAEAQALKRELIARLSGLRDEQEGEIAIRRVYATEELYRGPYLEGGPDLIVGFNDGYRTDWGAALGQVTDRVFEDNRKVWSGDHAVDPELVPGVLFCNRRLEAADPGIEDLAPTALALFGLEPPAWMEGKPLSLLPEEAPKA